MSAGSPWPQGGPESETVATGVGGGVSGRVMSKAESVEQGSLEKGAGEGWRGHGTLPR